MKIETGYMAVESNAPFRGLATTPASTRLDPAYSPAMINCIVRDGIVRRRGGYQPIGQRLVGRVLALVEFGKLDNDPKLVALTSHRQYVYDVATNLFIDLTPGQVSHTITAVDTKKFTVAGNQTAGFTAGRLVPVVGGVNAGVYTVVSSTYNAGPNTTTITVLEDLVSDVTVAGALVLATDLVTGERDFINHVIATDLTGHRLIITNGVNSPRVWDGDNMTPFATWSPTFPNFVTCKTLQVFDEHLFLGGIVLSGGEEPQTIAWSNAGSFNDFTGGDSGSQILYQLTRGIQNLRLLGDRLAIYSPDAIMTGVYVGLPVVFAFELVIPEGTRLASPKSVLSINVGHVYLSEENIYIFDGTRGLRVLGEAIYSDYKEQKDFENLHRCATLNDYSSRTLYFSVPGISGEFIVYTATYDVFDLSQIIWAKHIYAHFPSAFGFFTNHQVELLWEDASWEPASSPWNNELGIWAGEAEQLEFPIRCFGTPEGRVFICTEGTLNDNTAPQEQLYDTMDFTVPTEFLSANGRWTEIELEILGDTLDVSISTDLGNTFEKLETLGVTGSFRKYRILLDRVSRTIRVRLQSDSYFWLRWLRLWVRPSGPR